VRGSSVRERGRGNCLVLGCNESDMHLQTTKGGISVHLGAAKISQWMYTVGYLNRINEVRGNVNAHRAGPHAHLFLYVS
jgi:hypothetical protein